MFQAARVDEQGRGHKPEHLDQVRRHTDRVELLGIGREQRDPGRAGRGVGADEPANSSAAAVATRRSAGRSAAAIPVASSSATANMKAKPRRGSVRRCRGTSPACAPALIAHANTSTLWAEALMKERGVVLACTPS